MPSFPSPLRRAILLCALPCACTQTSGTGGGYLLPDGGAADSQPVAVGQAFEASIGPAGGTLSAGPGNLVGLRLDVPAEAVQTDTLFRCVEKGDVPHPLYAGAGPAAHCTPDDAPFDKQVTVTLPYDDSKLPAGGPAALSGLQQIPSGQIDVIDQTTVDLNAKTVSMSLWSLGVLQAGKVAPTTGRGG